MEENVALDTAKQKKFVKSIKGIKKLIKKNEKKSSEEVESPKLKNGKPKRKRPDRGLVYLSHIPHGFYEHEMTQYFKQFGLVTNVRVIRSKRTGNSKGFAFVEFKEPAVAEIVAETMNNYLMGKRLIKAAYVPPEKQRPKAMRKHWSRLNNPGRDARLKNKKSYNADRDDKAELKRARKMLSNVNKTKKKLNELGINYDFFTPVDIPEGLQIQNSPQQSEQDTKDEKKPKKDKKAQLESKDTVAVKKEKGQDNKKSEKNKAVKSENKKETIIKNEGKKPEIKREKKPEPVVNKKEQKQKQMKLKESGVKPPENFIKVQEESDDSDSSVGFDSDEYEKMLEEDGSDIDSNANSDDEGDSVGDDDDGEGSDDDDDESEEEEIPPPAKKSKVKGKPAPLVARPQPQKQGKQKGKAPEQVKRKAAQKPQVSPKKPRFEKQTQQPMKKQFKKKK